MGCGASTAADERSRQPSESGKPAGQAKRRTNQQSAASVTSNVIAAKDDRYKDGQLQGVGALQQATPQDGILSQALLNDLKQKSTKESNSVTRWVESIVEPSDTDNADLYDPRRRHLLSMESIANRQQQMQQHQQHQQQPQPQPQLQTVSEHSLSGSRDEASDRLTVATPGPSLTGAPTLGVAEKFNDGTPLDHGGPADFTQAS
jgi:hypothetical protein